MRIITEQGKKEMIFRKDINGYPKYNIGISRKTDGKYENSYFEVRFKKGTEIENRTMIVIKDAFMTFDKWTDKEAKERTTNYIFIMDFDVVEEKTEAEKTMHSATKSAWEQFSEELTDEDLPF